MPKAHGGKMKKHVLGLTLVSVAIILAYAGAVNSWGGSRQGAKAWLQSAKVFRITRTIDCLEHQTDGSPEYDLCRSLWESAGATDIIQNHRSLELFSIPAWIYFPGTLLLAITGVGLVGLSLREP